MKRKLYLCFLNFLIFINNMYMLAERIWSPDDDDNDDNDDGDRKNISYGLITIQTIIFVVFLGFNLIGEIADHINWTTGANLAISGGILFVYELMFSVRSRKGESPNYNFFSPWYSNYQFNTDSPSPFTLDSMRLFKLSYLILIIIGIIFSENKTSSMLIIIAFGFGFQLLNNAILYLLSEKEIIPSIFIYLDEYMKNSNIDDKTVKGTIFEFIGLFRILSIFAISIIAALHFKVEGKIVEFLGAFTLIFTLTVVCWQLFIGDECILDRTMNKYKQSYTDKPDESAGTQMISGSLGEIIQAQGGAFFNIAIIIIVLIVKDK